MPLKNPEQIFCFKAEITVFWQRGGIQKATEVFYKKNPPA